MVNALVFKIQPRTVLRSLTEASAINFFMEIMCFLGKGSDTATGRVTALVAKGTAFAILSVLLWRSGQKKMELSM